MISSALPVRPRVLVGDDSDLARDLIVRGLSLDPGLDVVGQAADVYDARDKIVSLLPDVVTLDVEMPRMDGIEFLRRLMPQYPLPVIVVSAFTAEGSRRAYEALEAGAVDIVGKPRANDSSGLKDMLLELASKVKLASAIDKRKLAGSVFSRAKQAASSPLPAGGMSPRPAHGACPDARPRGKPAAQEGGWSKPLPEWKPGSPPCIVAIGASTGGVAAVSRIVSALPADSPPIVIVQHMPATFTRLFAQSLDRSSAMVVREAADGQRLVPGAAFIGPGDFHLRVLRDASGYILRCEAGEKVSGHRPSVDVLFESVAKAAASRAIGLLLTGMGRDGADGLLAMRRAGAVCLAQDEESSVVFGMPQEAWRIGAAERLVPLERAAAELMRASASISRQGDA
jgi:two-component system chemotaxis response regulator CheB